MSKVYLGQQGPKRLETINNGLEHGILFSCNLNFIAPVPCNVACPVAL